MAPAEDNPGMKWLFFSPSGRLGRRPYFMAILFWMVVPGIAISRMFANEHHDAGLAFWTLVLGIICLASLVSFIMLSIKRLHDMGFPAIFVLLLFVPVVSFLALIVLLFWPSGPANDFGNLPNRPK